MSIMGEVPFEVGLIIGEILLIAGTTAAAVLAVMLVISLFELGRDDNDGSKT